MTDPKPDLVLNDPLITGLLDHYNNKKLLQRYIEFYESFERGEHEKLSIVLRNIRTTIFGGKTYSYFLTISLKKPSYIGLSLVDVFHSFQNIDNLVENFLESEYKGWFFERKRVKDKWGVYGGDLSMLRCYFSDGIYESQDEVERNLVEFNSIADAEIFLSDGVLPHELK